MNVIKSDCNDNCYLLNTDRDEAPNDEFLLLGEKMLYTAVCCHLESQALPFKHTCQLMHAYKFLLYFLWTWLRTKLCIDSSAAARTVFEFWSLPPQVVVVFRERISNVSTTRWDGVHMSWWWNLRELLYMCKNADVLSPILWDAAILIAEVHRPTGLILPPALSYSSVTICSIYDPILTSFQQKRGSLHRGVDISNCDIPIWQHLQNLSLSLSSLSLSCVSLCTRSVLVQSDIAHVSDMQLAHRKDMSSFRSATKCFIKLSAIMNDHCH